MKNKLVLWGTNENDEKVLIALELRPEENKVDIWTFKDSVVTEEFTKQMMNDWRANQEVAFPEDGEHQQVELTASQSILPESLKVERGDLIQRAQTEWHFVVLSTKLNQVYRSELDEIKEKINSADAYANELWDELKTYWDKVQEQVREKNLFREHADNLRVDINELFNHLKDLRKAIDDAFHSTSMKIAEDFSLKLDAIEKKKNSGGKMAPLFDELKQLQAKLKEAHMTKDHRSKVWEKLDILFKNVKDIRFGTNSSAQGQDQNSASDRLNRRYQGLIQAIEKMEQSIKRDKEDLEFQDKKISSSFGQLEAQIRQAKIKMIEERIRSKEEKLNEMLQTKVELDSKSKQLEEKEAKRAEREKYEAAKKDAASKIANEIKTTPSTTEPLEVAAVAGGVLSEEINSVEEHTTVPEQTTQDQIAETAGSVIDKVKDTLTDAVEAAKVAAEIVEDKLEEIGDKVEDFVEDLLGKKDDEEEEDDDKKD
ncbi:MAG: hypothetical protein KA010_00820 [Saprospiraceae bacterium]|nr:hypothetical protein [Saprospiraceae bacterium]